MRFTILALFLFYSLNCEAASLPGFDCLNPNLSYIEKLICGSDRLSELDLELNAYYKQALEENSEDRDKIAKLKESQKKWLSERDKKCSDIAKPYTGEINTTCLRELYKTRISLLYKNLKNIGSWRDDVTLNTQLKILDKNIEQGEKRIFEEAAKGWDKRKADKFIEEFKKQKKIWEESVSLSCGLIENYYGGTGAGNRTQSCIVSEKIRRLDWMGYILNRLKDGR